MAAPARCELSGNGLAATASIVSPRRRLAPSKRPRSSSTRTISRLSSTSLRPRWLGVQLELAAARRAHWFIGSPSASFIIGPSMAKVLIVEDDDVIAQGMARHLDASGFDPWSSPRVTRPGGGCASSALTWACSTSCCRGFDGWKVIE